MDVSLLDMPRINPVLPWVSTESMGVPRSLKCGASCGLTVCTLKEQRGQPTIKEIGGDTEKMVTSQRSLATAASHLDRRQISHKAGLVGLNGEAGAAEDGDPAGSKQPRPVGDCPKWWQRADKRNVVILLTSGDSFGGRISMG